MISNFDVAVPIKEKIEENASYGCYHDFYKCILSFLPEYKINKTDYLTGFNELIKKENKDNMKEFFSILYRLLTKYMIRQESEFTYQNLMNFIKGLFQYFKKNQLLLTKIPSGEKIINKEPYVIGKDFLSRY